MGEEGRERGRGGSWEKGRRGGSWEKGGGEWDLRFTELECRVRVDGRSDTKEESHGAKITLLDLLLGACLGL